MVIQLDEQYIDDMMELQEQCIGNDDIFLPTSKEGYLRAFQYKNFCFGDLSDGRLNAFLNCSIPTEHAAGNLGRGFLEEAELNRVGHMNTLLVRRECRHHGAGRELVETSLREFMRRGCPHIFVTASPENRASLRLLDAMSFTQVDTILMQGQERCLLYRNLEKDGCNAGLSFCDCIHADFDA